MKIFISHRSKDHHIVKKVTDIFDKYYIKYWIDEEEIEYPDNIRGKINEGLKNATHFLLVWSKNAQESKEVQKEIDTINSSDYDHVKKFSFRLDDTPLPYGFASNTYVQINQENVEEKTQEFVYKFKGSFETQIRIYKQRVIDDFIDFRCRDITNNPIVKNFEKYDIYNRFVSQNYSKLSITKTNTSDYFDIQSESGKDIRKKIIVFLKETKTNFIPIVGEYGSGKSLLSMHILYDFCKDSLTDQETVPIYIPLGNLDYTKSNISNKGNHDFLLNIFEYVKKEYGIIDEKFLEYSNSGKIIYILDAFDELSPTINEKDINDNFKLIKNVFNKGNRTILTSRHTYLSRQMEEKWFIEGYDLYKIEDFDNTQINSFLERNDNQNKDRHKKDEILEFINKHQFYDIVKKPLFFKIIYDNIENIKKEGIVNPATIFKSLTEEWIIHDVDKIQDPDRDKKKNLKDHRQRISEVLATHANQKNNMAISKKDIEDLVLQEFESAPEDIKDHLTKYFIDAQNSTFLIKQQSDGNEDTFSFIYTSVMEYFVARRIVTTINNKNRELLLEYCQHIKTKETFAFIHYIMDIEWAIKPHIIKDLSGYIKENFEFFRPKIDKIDFIYKTIEYIKNKSFNKKATDNPCIGKLVSLYYSISDFGRYNYKKDINHFPNEIDFSYCNLNGANITSAIMPGVKFNHAILNNANLAYSVFNVANFINSEIAYANLSGANLTRANLNGANLSNSNLTGSYSLGANLSYANLCDANLTDANLSRANLTRANLTDTSLYEANLFGANLTRANLTRANLFEANLTRANLNGANLRGALNLPISRSEAKKRGASV